MANARTRSIQPTDGHIHGAAFYDSFDDQRFKKSWYYENKSTPVSVFLEETWPFYNGQGINIGILDSMVAFHHPDLADNYDASLDYDLTARTDDLVWSHGNASTHGTKVAGVVSAVANDEGIVGVAHGAKFSSLAFDYGSQSVVEDVLLGFEKAKQLDVLNASWSFATAFADNMFTESDYYDALRAPVAEGRDGLGTVVVFAAGNRGGSSSSNYQGFQNSPLTIAVGAVDREGNAASFTSTGYNVLVSAAGREVFTTSYTNHHSDESGTSFAAPIVSGIVALMLEANPDLGYRDVQQILAYSARREGLGDDAWGTGWIENAADNYNGGGLHYNDAFGYGFVNGHDAVRLAETWTYQQTLHDRESVTYRKSFDDLWLTAGEVDYATFSFDVEEDMLVEHVQLAVDFRWVDSADVDIYLTSPEGTRSHLLYDFEDAVRAGQIRNFPFSTVASMGEESAGTWTVEILNRNPESGLSSRIKDATLVVHGRADGLADDVYVYTDEFGLFADADALERRKRLEDTDGGTDSLNAAAVTSASILDLREGNGTRIAGHEVRLSGTLENAFAGDGDDVLIGNDADNTLFGGRGDDVFHVSAGNDTIEGGSGTDTAILEAAIGDVGGFLGDAGEVVLELASGVGEAVSSFFDVEQFRFLDASLALGDVKTWLGGAADDVADGAPDTGGGDDTPSGEADSDPAAGGSDDAASGGGGHDTSDGGSGDDASGGDGDGTSDGGAGDGSGDAPMDFRGSTSADTIEGGSAGDWLNGSLGDDRVEGQGGDDTLFGGGDHDTLVGGDGDDALNGGDGDDVLVGDAGVDKFRGKDGADTFRFLPSTLGQTDIVRDFTVAEGDVLDVSPLTAAFPDIQLTLSHDESVSRLHARIDGSDHVIAEIRSQDLIGMTADSAADVDMLIA